MKKSDLTWWRCELTFDGWDITPSTDKNKKADLAGTCLEDEADGCALLVIQAKSAEWARRKIDTFMKAYRKL